MIMPQRLASWRRTLTQTFGKSQSCCLVHRGLISACLGSVPWIATAVRHWLTDSKDTSLRQLDGLNT